MKNGYRMMVAIIILIFIGIFILRIGKNKNAELEEKPKIGILTISDNRLRKINGLIDGLNYYDYKPEDTEIILKNANEEEIRLVDLCQELIEDKVDIIVTTGIQETNAAKLALGNSPIPIVFIGVGCSLSLGYVDDYLFPTCNITGVDSHYVQLSAKRIEYLKRLLPGIGKLLIVYNPSVTPMDASKIYLDEAQIKGDLEVIIEETTNNEETLTILEKYKNITDAAMLMCNLYKTKSIESIVDFSKENKFPILGVSDRQVEKGLLGFYGITAYEEGLQSARIVANILRGQSPDKIPIEAPENLEFHLNVETAKLLGIEVDEKELIFVDKFIK